MVPTVREFLLRVLPWPGDDGSGYCNVHCQMRGDMHGWTGTPTKDVDTFLQVVREYLQWPTPPDIYICMSSQRDVKPPNNKGQIRAAKSHEGAIHLKSIFLDIDVKPRAYATLNEAAAALQEFCATSNLPKPTALVASGGGLHAYWASETPLTVAEWQPYANGLKALAQKFFGTKIDAGVTGDAARVLRMPSTFNYKYTPPAPVRLLGCREKGYDFARDLAVLPTMSPVASMAVANRFFDPALFRKGALPPEFASLPLDSVGAGIEKREAPPVDVFAAAKECGWLKEALVTGGKDFSQGLWNLNVLTAVFLEDGHELAHKMSKGHPEYSHDETEALWERKVAEQNDRGLGWPSCAAIQGEGCTHCATCVHLVERKSPLHTARVHTLAAQQKLAPTSALAQPMAANTANALAITPAQPLVPLVDADLPPNYVIKDLVVHVVTEVPDRTGGPPTQAILPLFYCELFRPWAQIGPDALNFMATTSLGNIVPVSIKQAQFGPNKILDALLEGGVKYIVENKRFIEGFVMSWMNKLHKAAAARASQPFGWMMDGSVCTGFTYGGVIYRPDGSTDPAGSIDPEMASRYTPVGKLQPWLDACKLLTDQRRPGVEIIAAAAFGSPLMFACGEYGTLISVFSDSGANKTTAQRIGMAVWGHPKLTKETPSSTYKSVLNVMGQTKVLPSYWDEILNEEAQIKVHDVLWVQVLGNEGSRLNTKIQQQHKGDWANIGVMCSNRAFSDLVIRKNPDTKAGLVRVLEYEETVPAQKGRMTTTDAQQINMVLDQNYGMMGREYAKVLAENRPSIHQRTVDMSNGIIHELGLEGHERFWPATCASILVGAELANTLGCEFHVPEMRAFMIKQIIENRNRIADQHLGAGTMTHTEYQLTAFLKAYTRHTLRTETAPLKKPGRAAPVHVLSTPQPGFPVHVHWVLGNMELRFSQREFNNWLRDPKQSGSPAGAMAALRKQMNARTERGKLGIGTTYVAGPEVMIVIPVLPASELNTIMRAYSDPNSPGAEPSTMADTGLMQALAENPDYKPQVEG